MRCFTQLGMDARIAIEKGIEANRSFNRIAEEIGKDRSTVAREVKRNRSFVEGGPRRGRPAPCIHTAADCPVSRACGKPCIRKNCCGCRQACNSRCSGYEKKMCDSLSKPPYVCNRCGKRHNCTQDKLYYRANPAHGTYEKKLSEARSGISLSPERQEQVMEVLLDGFARGLSLHQIIVSHGGEEEFGLTEKTLYNYVNGGVFPGIGRTDHPRRQYRPRRKSLDISYKVDKKCLAGRRYEDYLAYMESLRPNVPYPVQMDSVVGSTTGCLLTIHFTVCNLMLAFHRERNTASTVAEIFDMLWMKLGSEKFSRLFPVILTDNGSEFSDPLSVEMVRHSGELRTRVFYCHPNASWEKGECEVNHEYIRRIIPKGTAIDISQEEADLMMSHINCSPRESLNDVSPYDLFRVIYGEEVLSSLGIRYIPPDSITLKPALLKHK